jgi:hypothetical protein
MRRKRPSGNETTPRLADSGLENYACAQFFSSAAQNLRLFEVPITSGKLYGFYLYRANCAGISIGG